MTTRYQTARVSFRGQFPLDMLRYDGCYPATQADVTTMALTQGTVTVARIVPGRRAWTLDRWASFGADCVPVRDEARPMG